LGVLIIPVLLAIVAALALIVLQVVNIIITVLVLATNFGVSTFYFNWAECEILVLRVIFVSARVPTVAKISRGTCQRNRFYFV